jgi:hypothetical protein
LRSKRPAEAALGGSKIIINFNGLLLRVRMLTGGCGARPRTACKCAFLAASGVVKSPLDSADNFVGASRNAA